MMIEYRWMKPEEFSLCAEGFGEESVPHPQLASILGAWDGEKLIGFIACQLIPHTEPLWINQDYRHQGVWKGLIQGMIEFIRTAHIPTVYMQPTSQLAAMCAAASGAKPCDEPLWVLRMEQDNPLFGLYSMSQVKDALDAILPEYKPLAQIENINTEVN